MAKKIRKPETESRLLMIERLLIAEGFQLQHIENFDENHPLYQLFSHAFDINRAKHIIEAVPYDHQKISNALEVLRKIYQEVNTL